MYDISRFLNKWIKKDQIKVFMAWTYMVQCLIDTSKYNAWITMQGL